MIISIALIMAALIFIVLVLSRPKCPKCGSHRIQVHPLGSITDHFFCESCKSEWLS